MASELTPLVLLHGVGLDRSMWSEFHARARALTSREIIALDLPGHGAEPDLADPVTLAELAGDVARRLPGRVHLLGFSLGALVSQHLARFRPELVASLTSVSSVCQRTPEEAAAVLSRLETGSTDFPASVEASLQRWYPADCGVPDSVIDRTRKVLLSNDIDSYLHAYRVFTTGDAVIGPELHRIETPALALTGELDPGSTPEMSRRLATAIPGCRLEIYTGVRHMLPVERAAELARSVTTFISESTGEPHA